MQNKPTNNRRIPLYFFNPKDGTEMVLIPGGWFRMGSEDSDSDAFGSEKPKHLHYVAPFYLAVACITVAQFRLFVEETGHKNDKNWDKDPDNHPVRYVNWHDATVYCKWADLRLPTEPEWEVAARGYSALKYPWGHDWEDGKKVCWRKQKGPKGNSAPVYDHPKGTSTFGMFQQSGNLYEWCADNFNRDVYKRYSTGDFKAPDGDRRVLRGGSWSDSGPEDFRSARRGSFNPDTRYLNFGFRSARTVTL